jgi:hypothetical protein
MAKKASTAIPTEVKEDIEARVGAFNTVNKCKYEVKFKGKFCYLSRTDIRPLFTAMFGAMNKPVVTEIGRLEWKGDSEKMNFAVYKYSRDGYDADEFLFSGSNRLNGTIEGAMIAGFEIYPV